MNPVGVRDAPLVMARREGERGGESGREGEERGERGREGVDLRGGRPKGMVDHRRQLTVDLRGW